MNRIKDRKSTCPKCSKELVLVDQRIPAAYRAYYEWSRIFNDNVLRRLQQESIEYMNRKSSRVDTIAEQNRRIQSGIPLMPAVFAPSDTSLMVRDKAVVGTSVRVITQLEEKLKHTTSFPNPEFRLEAFVHDVEMIMVYLEVFNNYLVVMAYAIGSDDKKLAQSYMNMSKDVLKHKTELETYKQQLQNTIYNR